MSVKITRCPQCQTSFKVSAEHLAIAAGAVRCGSCLHVFQALDHLVPQAPLAAVAQANSASQPSTAATQPSSAAQIAAPSAGGSAVSTAAAVAATSASASKASYEIDDDTLISDDMDFPDDEEESVANESDNSDFANSLLFGEDMPTRQFDVPDELNVELAAEEDWQRALTAGSDTAAAQGDSDDYSDLFDDEDWDEEAAHNAEDLSLDALGIAEEAVELQATPASATTVANNGTDLAEFDDFDSDQLLAELQATIADLSETQQTAAAATQSASATGNLRFGSEAGTGEPEYPATVSSRFDTDNSLDFDPDGDIDLSDHHTMRDIAVEDLGLNPAELPPVASTPKPLIDQIEPLPVDIGRFEPEPTDWLALVKGFAACAALCAVFFAQFVFFNFHDLAHDLSARSWLGKICQTGICQLPTLDPARVVKISNLIVREHPSEPNALAIDAILLNTESEPVPVPELELLFSTMEKLPLASRRFKPQEFLAGELAGQRELPPGRPVHIALAIVEPGPDAVNWTLSVKRAAE